MFHAGQLDVSAFAVDNTPYMNRKEWQLMTHWIPDDVWKLLGIKSGMQDDVNGVPRAGAISLLDRGVNRLWTGINIDLGGAPQKTPSAFWWKMPDQRRLFVWLAFHTLRATIFSYHTTRVAARFQKLAIHFTAPPRPRKFSRRIRRHCNPNTSV